MNEQANYDFSIRATALQHASQLNGGTATIPVKGVDELLADAAKIEAYLRGEGLKAS